MGVTASAATAASVNCDFQGSIRQYVGNAQVITTINKIYYSIDVICKSFIFVIKGIKKSVLNDGS